MSGIFTVKFSYWTRPMHRKGRCMVQEVTFKAPNLFEALREAKKYGREIWHGRRWQIVACQLREWQP